MKLFLFIIHKGLCVKKYRDKTVISRFCAQRLEIVIKNVDGEIEKSIMHFCQLYGTAINMKLISFDALRWFRLLTRIMDYLFHKCHSLTIHTMQRAFSWKNLIEILVEIGMISREKKFFSS